MMKRNRNRRGFTLAEVLIVVAIIAALSGLAAVGIVRYQRSFHQLEMDGHAKEIFVAAQNHLSMAKSQNYPGISGDNAYGTQLLVSAGAEPAELSGYTDIYYFTVGDGAGSTAFSDETPTLLDEMLPYASVDETLRLGGSYVVFYQKSTGTVLDVFYDKAEGSRFGCNFTASEGQTLMGSYRGADKKASRAKYRDDRKYIIGWYGSGLPIKLPDVQDLDAPRLLLRNADTLKAWVLPPEGSYTGMSQPDSGTYKLTLTLHGAESGNDAVVPLVTTGTRVVWDKYEDLVPAELQEAGYIGTYCYEIVLDDITQTGMRFAAGFTDLIPGEDIDVTAELAPASTASATVPKTSETVRTNSLFAYNKSDDNSGTVNEAHIAYIRHLENLEEDVSAFDPAAANYKTDAGLVRALQIDDLSWSASTYPQICDGSVLTTGSYYPVNPGYTLSYNGRTTENGTTVVHTISDVVIDTSNGGAGIFGTLGAGSSVENLKIENISVEVSGDVNAGALAGKLQGTVTNVAAYNTGSSAAVTVKSGGSAGGLAGELDGGAISRSAAALVVESTGGSAGGLVGTASGGSISASYSGGHTQDGKYSDTSYNITGTNAGGLVGSASGVSISSSYSTCSVSGSAAAGGLVGAGTNGSISDSYSTGLVTGGTAGAFAGTLSGTTVTGCEYYKIINETATDTSVTYLGPVGGAEHAGVTPLDADLTTYDTFTGAPANWRKANPADSKLYTYYQGQYSLGTLAQLSGVSDTDLAAVHYGDWPAPELWVVNP